MHGSPYAPAATSRFLASILSGLPKAWMCTDRPVLPQPHRGPSPHQHTPQPHRGPSPHQHTQRVEGDVYKGSGCTDTQGFVPAPLSIYFGHVQDMGISDSLKRSSSTIGAGGGRVRRCWGATELERPPPGRPRWQSSLGAFTDILNLVCTPAHCCLAADDDRVLAHPRLRAFLLFVPEEAFECFC